MSKSSDEQVNAGRVLALRRAVGKRKLLKLLDETTGSFGWMPMWNIDETFLILNRRKSETLPTEHQVDIHSAPEDARPLLSISLQVQRG